MINRYQVISIEMKEFVTDYGLESFPVNLVVDEYDTHEEAENQIKVFLELDNGKDCVFFTRKIYFNQIDDVTEITQQKRG